MPLLLSIQKQNTVRLKVRHYKIHRHWRSCSLHKDCYITDCNIARNPVGFSPTLMQSSFSVDSDCLHPCHVRCCRQAVTVYCVSTVASHMLVTLPWPQCSQLYQLGRYADTIYSKGEMQLPVNTHTSASRIMIMHCQTKQITFIVTLSSSG